MSGLRVHVLHWEHEPEALVAPLSKAGHEVGLTVPAGMRSLSPLKRDPPDVLVIDLDRRPATGRDVALAVRADAKLRELPLLLAGGEDEFVAAARELLPDATFAPWARIRSAVREAAGTPVPARPAAPSKLAGYAGTPLAKKLGLKPGARVALVGAPEGFEAALGPLPEGTTLAREARGARDLTVWFVRERAALDRRIGALAKVADGGLWICWPRRNGGLAGDLGEREVRAAGLAHGLVDHKVAAIDEAWSGLRFAVRKPAPGRNRAAAPRASRSVPSGSGGSRPGRSGSRR